MGGALHQPPPPPPHPDPLLAPRPPSHVSATPPLSRMSPLAAARHTRYPTASGAPHIHHLLQWLFPVHCQPPPPRPSPTTFDQLAHRPQSSPATTRGPGGGGGRGVRRLAADSHGAQTLMRRRPRPLRGPRGWPGHITQTGRQSPPPHSHLWRRKPHDWGQNLDQPRVAYGADTP